MGMKSSVDSTIRWHLFFSTVLEGVTRTHPELQAHSRPPLLSEGLIGLRTPPVIHVKRGQPGPKRPTRCSFLGCDLFKHQRFGRNSRTFPATSCSKETGAKNTRVSNLCRWATGKLVGDVTRQLAPDICPHWHSRRTRQGFPQKPLHALSVQVSLSSGRVNAYRCREAYQSGLLSLR